MNSEKLAKDLADSGWSFDAKFIALDLAERLLIEAICARENGQFISAGVGKNSALAKEIRRDEIMWLEPNALSPSQSQLWKMLEEFKNGLNRSLFLGLSEFEAHFAHYSKDGFYSKHVDRFRDDDRRTISMVIYLNSGWSQEDGGLLNLYSDGEKRIIVPESRSMVCFLSDRIEHEVTLSKRDRWSIAVWFKTPMRMGMR